MTVCFPLSCFQFPHLSLSPSSFFLYKMDLWGQSGGNVGAFGILDFTLSEFFFLIFYPYSDKIELWVQFGGNV